MRWVLAGLVALGTTGCGGLQGSPGPEQPVQIEQPRTERKMWRERDPMRSGGVAHTLMWEVPTTAGPAVIALVYGTDRDGRLIGDEFRAFRVNWTMDKGAFPAGHRKVFISAPNHEASIKFASTSTDQAGKSVAGWAGIADVYKLILVESAVFRLGPIHVQANPDELEELTHFLAEIAELNRIRVNVALRATTPLKEGEGWYCFNAHAGPYALGHCRRTLKNCVDMRRELSEGQSDTRFDECHWAERAACFEAYHRLSRKKTQICSTSFESCKGQRELIRGKSDDWSGATECEGRD